MKIVFLGATTEVTGSMTLVEAPEGHFLVDCGMYQGLAKTEKMNSAPFPFNPQDLKAVLLTHAHLDHCGMLPKLVKEGFHGTIYSTKATLELTKIILEDSASINNKYYETSDVRNTLNRVKAVEWNETVTIAGASVKFLPAGHILGASSIKISAEGKSVLFSGDLGRKNDLLIKAPEISPLVDLVVMESTYGGKIRQGNSEKELHSFLMDISRNKKTGIIASFAVARGQLLLTMIHDFFERHPEDKFPVYVDSPMMEEACEVYKHFAHFTLMPKSLQEAMKSYEHIHHERQWDSLKKKSGPLLVISSSGMMTGGRIARHLENWQDDKSAVLFLPGYQGEGTPGRSFLNGERTLNVPHYNTINWSGEVLGSEAFSSHADQTELIHWLGENKRVFLIHGEKESKETLCSKLRELNVDCKIPSGGESIRV